MNLNLVIAQIRNYCPVFSGRVAGAAEFNMLPETTAMPVPVAYVIPLDDNPGERMSLNDVRQPLMDAISIIVAVSNVADERGQSAVNTARGTIRAALWKALLGWQPEADYRGMEYQGGHLIKKDRARLWYQFDFAAYMEIGPEDGWQGVELDALPHFDGMAINVDDIDPAADPNVSYPGPDDRIEHTIVSPKTGNLP